MKGTEPLTFDILWPEEWAYMKLYEVCLCLLCFDRCLWCVWWLFAFDELASFSCGQGGIRKQDTTWSWARSWMFCSNLSKKILQLDRLQMSIYMGFVIWCKFVIQISILPDLWWHQPVSVFPDDGGWLGMESAATGSHRFEAAPGGHCLPQQSHDGGAWKMTSIVLRWGRLLFSLETGFRLISILLLLYKDVW